MADVDEIPRIRCDNCGTITNKSHADGGYGSSWHKPSNWGHISASAGSIPGKLGKATLGYSDLCPRCADAMYEAAAKALKETRGE